MISWTIGCAIWGKSNWDEKDWVEKVCGEEVRVNFWICEVGDFISRCIKNNRDSRQGQCGNMREELKPLEMNSGTQGRYDYSN